MSWPAVESYRQLESEYDAALEEYNQASTAYHEAVAANAPPTQLKEQYEVLTTKRDELAELFERLKGIRNSLADEPKKLLF